VQIGENFTGSTFGSDSRESPPDANGAVGPAHFVELINGRYTVYDKTTGKRLQTMTDLQFWSAAGVTLASNQAASDPRLAFDPYTQRWFASAIDVNARRQTSNHFLLAVSQTADPTGAWNGAIFGADPNNLLFADFPAFGLDQDAVYLSGDMFDRYGNSVGPSLVAIPKSGLLTNPPDISGRVAFGTLSYDARGDILQPAITTGQATTPEPVIAVGDLGIDYQTHSTLILSTVLNGGSSSATLSNPAVTLNVPRYTVPLDPTQPDGSNNLDNGDARIAASARRVGDVLYVTHGVEVNQRAAVRWYRINVTTGALIESGNITDPTLDLSYPSIAANQAGAVVIGCNGSSGATYVSSYAVVGQVANGTLSFGSLTLLQPGTASYQSTDSTGTSRWGDYSTTTVDPVDPTRFWTIQTIAVGSSAWATHITEIITAPVQQPRLTLVASPQGLFLTWPATGVAYQLQSSPVLGPNAQWSAIVQSPTVENNVNSVALQPSQSQGFLRLVSAPGAGPSQN
jgi:hypothetical protein